MEPLQFRNDFHSALTIIFDRPRPFTLGLCAALAAHILLSAGETAPRIVGFILNLAALSLFIQTGVEVLHTERRQSLFRTIHCALATIFPRALGLMLVVGMLPGILVNMATTFLLVPEFPGTGEYIGNVLLHSVLFLTLFFLANCGEKTFTGVLAQGRRLAGRSWLLLLFGGPVFLVAEVLAQLPFAYLLGPDTPSGILATELAKVPVDILLLYWLMARHARMSPTRSAPPATDPPSPPHNR